MKLTPLDVKRHQFAKGFRGYEAAEVDAFLQQISAEWESLLDEQRLSAERARELGTKLKHYERVEMALQEALETARDSARRTEETAKQKAAFIVEQAEARALEIVASSERDRYGVRQDVMNLTNRQNEISARLRGFLLSELEILAQFQGDDPVGFIKLQPSQAPGQISARSLSTAATDDVDEAYAVDADPLESAEVAPSASDVVDHAPDADAADEPILETGPPGETIADRYQAAATGASEADEQQPDALKGAAYTWTSPYASPPSIDALANDTSESFDTLHSRSTASPDLVVDESAPDEPFASVDPGTGHHETASDVETAEQLEARTDLGADLAEPFPPPPPVAAFAADADIALPSHDPFELNPSLESRDVFSDTEELPRQSSDSSGDGEEWSSGDAPSDAEPSVERWSLRSLVTGEDHNAAGSEAERERIRRILDDLD